MRTLVSFKVQFRPQQDHKSRAATKLKDLEVNSTMLHLKMFLDNSNTILTQASSKDLSLYDCVVQFDLRKYPSTIGVLKYTAHFSTPELKKAFEDTRTKGYITCVYFSCLFNDEGSGKEVPTFQMQRLFPLQSMVMIKGVMEGNLLNLGQLDSLLRSDSPPIQQVVELGVLPKIVESLQRSDNNHDIQKKAVSILLNVAGGRSEHTEAVVESGAIPHLIRLLGSSLSEISHEAAWALGNIAGNNPEHRDLVLQAGILQPLLALLEQTNDVKLVRTYAWTLSNCCRFNPRPKWNLVSPSLDILKELIHHSDDAVLVEACTALHHMTIDGAFSKIQAVIDELSDTGIRRLLELCTHSDTMVQDMTLKVLGSMASGTEAQTQLLIDYDALPVLLTVLSGSGGKQVIMKEVCFAISNIACGSKIQLQAVFDCGIIPKLIPLL